MLLPRYSLRGLFGLITVCSMFFAVAAFAFRGQRWAIAVIAATGSLLVVAVIHATVFLVAWLLTLITGSFNRSAVPRSPFADETPSPQVISVPAEPE
jgi:hypothetical protein